MMDRHKPVVEKSQVGFIEFIIRPLYVQWALVVPEASVCMKHLAANLEYFQVRGGFGAPSRCSAVLTRLLCAPRSKK